MEFLLLSLKSVCMIAIRALTGMQLISNEEKMLRRQNIVFFAAVLRITANYSFHSSNFFIGHVHVRIRWRAFTGPNPSKLKSLLICLYPTIHFY